MFSTDKEIEITMPAYTGIETYYGADKIGFNNEGAFILRLFRSPPPPPQGTLFTVLAISGVQYRLTRETRAQATRQENTLVILDDWGQKTTITSGKEVIDRLEEECRNHQLFIDKEKEDEDL